MKKHAAFTLIEILVAIVILAVVGILTLTGLHTVINSQKIINRKADRLAEIQLAVIILERDIAQIINRPIRDTNGKLLPPLTVNHQDNGLNLEFTHAGFINPNAVEDRTTLQRVAYAWDGESLLRTSWMALDRTADASSDTQVLLHGVSSFAVRFYDPRNLFYVPPEIAIGPPYILPTGVEITLDVAGVGTIIRLIPLAGAL